MSKDRPKVEEIVYRRADWRDAITPDLALRLLNSVADLTLVCNPEGVIEEVAFGNSELVKLFSNDWSGRAWPDLVTADSRSKVLDLIRTALAASGSSPTRHREINLVSNSGSSIPVRFSAIALGGSNRIVAIGQEMRLVSELQQRLIATHDVLEQEFAGMRAAETRYRMLFQLASEPIMVVDAGSLKVVDLNPAAERHFSGLGSLQNRLVLSCFDYDSAQALESGLKLAAKAGKVEDVTLRAAGSGHRFVADANFFRQGRSKLYLLRLSDRSDIRISGEGSGSAARIAGVIEHLAEGVVLVDEARRILEVNHAFLDFAELGSKSQAIGQPLSNWFGRSAVDLDILMARLEENRPVRSFITVLRGSFGSEHSVEVSAAPAQTGQSMTYGFILRSHAVGQVAANVSGPPATSRSVEQLIELIGHVSLKTMVRQSSDMIEKLCIEAALEKTGENRASAAQLLDLSRQSLYTKMRRLGIGNLDGNWVDD